MERSGCHMLCESFRSLCMGAAASGWLSKDIDFYLECVFTRGDFLESLMEVMGVWPKPLQVDCCLAQQKKYQPHRLLCDIALGCTAVALPSHS